MQEVCDSQEAPKSGLLCREDIRNGAGTGKASLAVLPKGTKVANYGYYTLVGNIKWLYVQVTYKGVTYTGFCSSQYLKK